MYENIKFPIWKNDGKSVYKLTDVQKETVLEFNKKITDNRYTEVENKCLCGNTDKDLDILISEKDRYGIVLDIVLCKKCGLIRNKKRLDDESTISFYQNEYRTIYSGSKSSTDDFFINQNKRGESFYRLLSSKIDMSKINNVFEMGCGAGGILYKFFQNSKNVSGCDYGEEYLKYGISKGMNLYVGALDNNKTKENSQDLFVLSHVMEHFNHPLEELNKIINVVKPEGYLLIEVPGIYSMEKSYFENPIMYFQNAHVVNYYYYYLKVMYEKLGLEVVYGDEKCTFILKKKANWKPIDTNIDIFDEKMIEESKKIELYLKKMYFKHKYKLNLYFYRSLIVKLLDTLKIKNFIKKVMG